MEDTQTAQIAPRSPRQVMTLERMGCFHQSRLSFIRVLLRRLKSEDWTFDRPVFDINKNGVGVAVYCAHGPTHSYSLIAFANDLPSEKRSDRVIATEWDATFVLFDGIPEQADIDRLSQNVPKQEAGRITEKELSLSRANRSVRLWDYVVDCLAAGKQPCVKQAMEVGYLMRTTAVYGSGKFGAADRDATSERPEFQAPFQIEMLNVFLIRAFVMDLVEFMARSKAPERAVPLDAALRRRFGIGNSTGLGMAPFLINHPVLLNCWIAAREEALARIRSLDITGADDVNRFEELVNRAYQNALNWVSEHPIQQRKLADLRADMECLIEHCKNFDFQAPRPWDRMWLWAEGVLSLEGQEQLVSLLLEIRPALVDGLSSCMSADENSTTRIDGAMSITQLKEITETLYDWALEIDWSKPDVQARVWYTSEEKLEPRLGERFKEPIAAYEQALSPGRDVARMYADLSATRDQKVAAFCMNFPQHRHSVRRVQIADRFPYAEIRSNTIASDMLPIDLLRAKLSFFGAGHFDPRSDRWVRINLFQNAPFPSELGQNDPDDWTYPAAQ